MSSTVSPEQTSDQTARRQTMGSASFRLAVLAAPDDRDTALMVLQEVLGLNAIDAKTRLRHLPAVWPDEFSEDAAKEAAQRLQSLGVRAAAVPVTDVPDLRQARALHHVQCRGEGFVIMSIAGEPERTIGWPDLALLSVAEVAGLRQESVSNVPDGVFRHAPGIASVGVTNSERGLEIWLIAVSPFQAYRIDAELMNYEYLKDRLSPSTDANFAQLVSDIRRHATNLTLTSSAQAYLSESTRGPQRMPSPGAHRDAVAAHWVTQRDTSSRGTGSRSVPTTQRGDRAKSALGDDRLYQTHLRLHEEIDELRACCHDHFESDRSARSALMRQVEELRATINEHFALEEDGGYMRSVLDVAPRYSQLAESLQQQHPALRDQLEGLVAESGDLAAGIQNFIEALEAHEHAENALVQSAFSDDLAAGD